MKIETMNTISCYDYYGYYDNIDDADYDHDYDSVDYYYTNYYVYVDD